MVDIINPMTISEKLAYATVRIDTEAGAGTGFLIYKKINEKTIIPLLVTNKHVIYADKEQTCLTQKGQLIFHKANSEGEPINDVVPVFYEKDFGKNFVLHPDSSIDLCALNIAPIIDYYAKRGINIFIRYIQLDLIPTEAQLAELDYMEDIFMIGYPCALRDDIHNYPIIRKGITATHPCIDFNGKKEFLADIANMPGSSGSPVFLFKNGYVNKQGDFVIGQSILFFMGISYSAPIRPVKGTIDIVDVPTAIKVINNLYEMTNLAYVIKSTELFALTDLFGGKNDL